MNVDLPIAATQTHGPPHILILGVITVAVVGWLIYRAVTRRSPGEDLQADPGPTTTASATDAPDSNRGRGL